MVVIGAQFMDKFNELKELVNASSNATVSSSSVAADKQTNGTDTPPSTARPDISQQQQVC